MTARVVRHEDYAAGAFDGADLVIVGPGPGDPREGDHPKIASFRRAVDDLLASGQPFLAVCLGHQTLCQRLGLDLGFKDIVFQGTQSPVRLDGRTERVGFYNTFVGRVPDGADAARTAYASRPTRPPATSTRSSGRTTAASSSTPSRSSPRTATTCSTICGARPPRRARPPDSRLQTVVEQANSCVRRQATNRWTSGVTLVAGSGHDGGAVGYFKGAWAGVCLLALMACGCDRGHGRRLAQPDDAAPQRVTSMRRTAALAPAASRAAQPNIVVVMLDDFSMDLVQTMRSVQQMREGRREYPHSFVADSLCCVSRSSIFTGQYPHQTGVRTNTSNTPTRRTARRLGRLRDPRQPRAHVQRAAPGGRLHTGFVGKFLNEYEWSPGRALPPVAAGLDDVQRRLRLGLRRLGVRQHVPRRPAAAPASQHPAPPAEREQRGQGQGVRRHGDRRRGDGLHHAPRDDGRAVLPRGGAVRAAQPRPTPRAHYAGDPLFPPAFRDRTGKPATAAASPAAR